MLAGLCDLCSAGTPGQCGTPALVTTVKEAAKMQQTDTQTQFHGDVDIIIRESLAADGMGTILWICNVSDLTFPSSAFSRTLLGQYRR